MNKEYSVPKVTIDLSEYSRLKDIEYQVFGVIKGKIEVKNTFVRSSNFQLDPLADYGDGKGVVIGRISDKDLAYFFNNLFNIDMLHVNMGDGIEFIVKNREGELR